MYAGVGGEGCCQRGGASAASAGEVERVEQERLAKVLNSAQYTVDTQHSTLDSRHFTLDTRHWTGEAEGVEKERLASTPDTEP